MSSFWSTATTTPFCLGVPRQIPERKLSTCQENWHQRYEGTNRVNLLSKSGSDLPEWVAATYRNEWLRLNGIHGRDFSECVATLLRNTHHIDAHFAVS